MLQVRYGMFESNSSSTHTLVIAQNDEIKKLENNELLIDLGWSHDKPFITYDEALELLKRDVEKNDIEEDKEDLASGDEEAIYYLLKEYDIAQRYDDYLDSEYLEHYEEEIVTEHGDKVLIFGIYGRDC